MNNLLLSWFVMAFAVWATAALLPGIQLRGAGNALVVAAIFGLLEWAIGWLLIGIIGIGTLGIGFLFLFVTRWVVNALLLKVTASLTPRIHVASFGWAMAGALMMSAVGTLAQYLIWGERAYRV